MFFHSSGSARMDSSGFGRMNRNGIFGAKAQRPRRLAKSRDFEGTIRLVIARRPGFFAHLGVLCAFALLFPLRASMARKEQSKRALPVQPRPIQQAAIVLGCR